MCRIFAGQDPADYAYETRSVRLSGHLTSVRLEARFWKIVEEIARRQNMTVGRFLSQLHDEALEIHGGVANFASLLRCSCLIYMEKGLAPPAAQRIPAE
jgi:predicted DNA-binding ribbon-helix-helix protein